MEGAHPFFPQEKGRRQWDGFYILVSLGWLANQAEVTVDCQPTIFGFKSRSNFSQLGLTINEHILCAVVFLSVKWANIRTLKVVALIQRTWRGKLHT